MNVAKFTNNYSILKDILKIEYTFILTILFNNFDEIIHLLKERKPFYGEVLEHLYLSMPSYYNSKHDKICQQYRYVDSILRILYKNNRKSICARFKQDVKEICKDFHMEENEFEYYYFIALLIITIENNINIDAYNLYMQFDEELKDNINKFAKELFKTLSTIEFQCLFYNHLEDVYSTNLSEDNKVSVIYKDNYSYFLDNSFIENHIDYYLQGVPQKRAPIIITDQYIYNVIDNKPYILTENTIDNTSIFNETVRYVASYYFEDHTIRNFIPFFNYFQHYNNLNNDICLPFYNDYNIKFPIERNELILSEDFMIFNNSNINDVHYYIDKFTVYRPFIEEED